MRRKRTKQEAEAECMACRGKEFGDCVPELCWAWPLSATYEQRVRVATAAWNPKGGWNAAREKAAKGPGVI
jgi:hypothetical protein